MTIINDAMLFFAASGMLSGVCDSNRQPAVVGVMKDEWMRPIAFANPTVDTDALGLLPAWESTGNADDFCKDVMGEPEYVDVPGLWVYEVSFDPADVSDQGDDWAHLRYGVFRRPTPDELRDATRAEGPWDGGQIA